MHKHLTEYALKHWKSSSSCLLPFTYLTQNLKKHEFYAVIHVKAKNNF